MCLAFFFITPIIHIGSGKIESLGVVEFSG